MDIRKELDKAYSLLLMIPVNGDYVEVMAQAKEHLRNAYAIIGEHSTPEQNPEGKHGR